MEKLSFKYIPLTFISSQKEIQRQIRNTIIFSYLNDKFNNIRELSEVLVSTQYGLNAAANELGKHKFLRISDIKEGVVDWNSVPFCDCKDEKTYKLYENDILVARTGGTTGKSFLINSPPSNSVFAGYLIRLRTKEDISSKLIYAFLNSYAYWSQISEMKMGSAQPNVNAEKLKKLRIPLAPTRILNEINNLLSDKEYDLPELEVLIKKGKLGYNSSRDIADLFKKQENLILKLRQSILKEAVQGKLTADWRKNNPDTENASQLLKRIKNEKAQLFKDKKIKKESPLPAITKDEIPYELPEGWVWCKLQDLVNVGTGSTPATSNTSYYNGTIPWYTSSATNDLFAKESEKLITEKALQETNCKVFPKGSLIIAMYGQGKTRGQISEIVIPGATNQAIAAMVFYKTSVEFKEYIKYFFRKIYEEIRLLAEGGAQPNLNVGKIKNTILPLPPLEEQKAIVEKVNALMGLCDRLEQEVEHNQELNEQLMKSVLREVFEGEKV